jgi:hypothetical protein
MEKYKLVTTETGDEILKENSIMIKKLLLK